MSQPVQEKPSTVYHFQNNNKLHLNVYSVNTVWNGQECQQVSILFGLVFTVIYWLKNAKAENLFSHLYGNLGTSVCFPSTPLVAEVLRFLWYCSLHIRDLKEEDGNAGKNTRLVVIVSYIRHCISKFHFVTNVVSSS